MELWVHVSAANKNRTIPVHILARSLGSLICNTIVAAYHLSGADYTSKVGTKLSAVRADPSNYLQNFGRGTSEIFIDRCIDQAESYLIQVLQKDSTCKSFNELRNYQFHYGTKLNISELPLTSASIHLHILRAYFVTYKQLNCLSEKAEILNPLQFGYIEDIEMLLPIKILMLLPPMDDFIPNCSCKACTRNTCSCVRAKIPCCSFCSCKKKNTCKNKFTEVTT